MGHSGDFCSRYFSSRGLFLFCVLLRFFLLLLSVGRVLRMKMNTRTIST